MKGGKKVAVLIECILTTDYFKFHFSLDEQISYLMEPNNLNLQNTFSCPYSFMFTVSWELQLISAKMWL